MPEDNVDVDGNSEEDMYLTFNFSLQKKVGRGQTSIFFTGRYHLHCEKVRGLATRDYVRGRFRNTLAPPTYESRTVLSQLNTLRILCYAEIYGSALT